MSTKTTVGDFHITEKRSGTWHHLKEAETRHLIEHQLEVRLEVSCGEKVTVVKEKFDCSAIGQYDGRLTKQADEFLARHLHGLRLDGQRHQFGLAGTSVEVYFAWDEKDFVRVRIVVKADGKTLIDSWCAAREITLAAEEWAGVKGNYAALLYPRVATLLQ